MSQCSPDTARCPHDMGFDNELGPIGCRLVGQELECVCEYMHFNAVAATPQRCDLLDALDWLESSANIKVGGFIPPEVKQHNQTAASHAEKLRLFLFGVAAQGWRDISTAPKDGTVCDLWIKGATAGRICDLWWCGDGTWCGHDASIFSHWMPAPVSGPSLTSTDREASK